MRHHISIEEVNNGFVVESRTGWESSIASTIDDALEIARTMLTAPITHPGMNSGSAGQVVSGSAGATRIHTTDAVNGKPEETK